MINEDEENAMQIEGCLPITFFDVTPINNMAPKIMMSQGFWESLTNKVANAKMITILLIFVLSAIF